MRIIARFVVALLSNREERELRRQLRLPLGKGPYDRGTRPQNKSPSRARRGLLTTGQHTISW